MNSDRAFDDVVVGAGSAGCVLASRLSEDPRRSRRSRGPDRKQEIHIPAAFSKLFKSDCDWAYFTEEQAGLASRSSTRSCASAASKDCA